MPSRIYRTLDSHRRHIGGVYYWDQRRVYYFFCARCWHSSGWRTSWEISSGPIDTNSHPIYEDQMRDCKIPCCYGACLNVVGNPDGLELNEPGNKTVDLFLSPPEIMLRGLDALTRPE